MFLLASAPWDTIGLIGASIITLGVAVGLTLLTRRLAFRPSYKQSILSQQKQQRAIASSLHSQRALPAPDADKKERP
jgi:hypothetical protein